MRKSTLVAMAIILVALVGITVMFKMYTGQFTEEIQHAKEWTKEMKDDLAPGSNLKLARVTGSSKMVVKDAQSPGLLVEAEPSEASWKSDRDGTAFARGVAMRAFETYGPDRPIRWLEFRLSRGDMRIPAFALERGDGRDVVPVGERR